MSEPRAEPPSPPDDAGRAQADAVTKKAVRGAFWTVSSGISSRIVGLVGTVLVTRFLDPGVYGDATLAAVVVQTAAVASSCGLSQYIVSKPKEGKEAVFHAAFFYIVLALIALPIPVIFRHQIGAMLHSPGAAYYIPFLAAATLLDRFTVIQDVIQVRAMNFRVVALQRSMGEIFYALVCVGLVVKWRYTDLAGYALVGGALARSISRLIGMSVVTPRSDWLTPCKITWERTRTLFRFGLPMSMAALANVGARRWDNLIIARHFGPATQGIYNLAYNLADIPATQLGETIGDVLVPSFAQIESDEERRKAFLRSTRIMMLIVAPMAIGLAMISKPLILTLLTSRWAKHAAHFLPILAGLSLVRPLGWVGSSYLQVKNRPRVIMALEWSKTVSLLVLMVILEQINVYWACAAVGVAFTLNSLAYAWVIRKLDGISLRDQLLQLVPPIAACAPMALAVYGVEQLIRFRLPVPAILAVELITGAIVFPLSAWVIAPSTTKDLIGLVREARRRRQGTIEA